ncbi:MAG TPA: universal stress protein [Longimicrobium sp.]|nr:universal stress protein [Longimicrobium sp.]
MKIPEAAAREPLETVLVPTDFSQGAGQALQRALLLPLALGARLHVVHVLPAGLPAKVRSKVETDARASLNGVVSRVREGARFAGQINVTAEVLRGEPFVEVIRCARGINAELIVLGRHGRRPIRDMFMGTTAERVIRKGDVPVLAVHLAPDRPYQRPLVATDLEDPSKRALDLALRVIAAKVRRVDVVHSFNVPFEEIIGPAFSAREKNDYRRTCREEAVAGLDKFIAPYQGSGIRWKAALRPGDARAVVLAEALRRKSDLIAVGTHGRSGVAHALVGSVAEWIVATAPCDVLVARPARFTFKLP